MPLQFILGPPGSGKTTHCLQEIEAALPGKEPLYYLVPEQFSLQSEKLLLASRAAITRVQVLSFNRLAYRLFAILGGPTGQTLDDLGKHMLLRKVLLEITDELVFYKRSADKHGFVNALASTITELNHYCISSEDLRLRSSEMGPVLGAKLQDLALIVSKYRDAVSGQYLLVDDMLDLLVHKLASVDGGFNPLAGAKIWADGFSGFTPQERQVLLHLMKQGADVKITLTTCEKPYVAIQPFNAQSDTATSRQDPLFTTPRDTLRKLTDLAARAHITVVPPIYMEENYRHAHNSGLAFFARNFTMRPSKNVHTAAGHDIEILSAPDRYATVYAAAHKILTWVDAGHRFKDIAVVCGNRGHYEKALTTAFDRLGIPLFVDTEIDILSHPLTELIRSALSILAYNWNYESVFRFLKTRLTGLDVDTIDILENFALAHGISGYRWRYPFSGAEEIFSNDADGNSTNEIAIPAETGRQHLLSALSVFGSAPAKDTVKGFSHKIFQMLYDLQVPKTLESWFDHHMAAGDPATARIHKQVWPKICEVFDKLVEILGNEVVNIETFSSILDAGLSQVSLGRIPPTVNQVVLGDMGRSRYPQIKAMLVLGANEGAFPPIAASPGLFSEDERRHLQNTDIELAPDNLARINDQYYALYCTLSQPSQQLAFIYAEGEPSGAVLRPSHVLRRIQALFSGLEITKAPQLREYSPIPAPALESPPVLESANDIYGPTVITAASRLESFARCPFAYFMNYLLLARPRKRHQVLPTDLGNLYHDVLARFTAGIATRSIDARTLDRDAINALAGQLISELTPEAAAFHASARNRHILSKAEGICAASIWALCEHIKRGEFMPIGAEMDFGIAGSQANQDLAESSLSTGGDLELENGRNLILTGRIDRVDLLQGDGGRQYIRIIDYKSGQTRFDITEVEQGTQLQLLLYMNALTKNPQALAKYIAPGHESAVSAGESTIHPAGIFYFPVDDPIIDADGDLTPTAIDDARLKRFRLSGVALAGDTILNGMDKKLAPGVDSAIIPVKMNKDGRLAKTNKPTVLKPEDFALLAQVAEDKVKELGQRMTNGDIEANPVKKGASSPCLYCNYGAICKKSL